MNRAATDRPGLAITPPEGRRYGFKACRCATLWLATAAATLSAADDNKIIFPAGTAPASAPAAAGGGTANALTLVIALLLAAVGAWVFWKNRKRPTGLRGVQNLAVEETRSLGNRQYLVVASYGHQKFLLGVCPGKIDMLAPLAPRDEDELES